MLERESWRLEPGDASQFSARVAVSTRIGGVSRCRFRDLGDGLGSGLLTQGVQGGRLDPLASRLHRILIHFPLNLLAI